jgi:hypothetical protein
MYIEICVFYIRIYVQYVQYLDALHCMYVKNHHIFSEMLHSSLSCDFPSSHASGVSQDPVDVNLRRRFAESFWSGGLGGKRGRRQQAVRWPAVRWTRAARSHQHHHLPQHYHHNDCHDGHHGMNNLCRQAILSNHSG